MIEARENFGVNIERAVAIGQVYAALNRQVTNALDLSDLLRFEIAQSVSAVDCLVHDIVIIGMLEVVQGLREPTNQFLQFNLSMDTTIAYQQSGDISLIEHEIRERHSHLSFQKPDKIADSFRLISTIDLWAELEVRFVRPKAQLKQQLALIVDRRNKIVHEGDLSPIFPRKAWPVTATDASQASAFMRRLGYSLLAIAELDRRS